MSQVFNKFKILKFCILLENGWNLYYVCSSEVLIMYKTSNHYKKFLNEFSKKKKKNDYNNEIITICINAFKRKLCELTFEFFYYKYIGNMLLSLYWSFDSLY